MNTIQTNATLIDREWAKFLSSHGFNVGVSVDGVQDTHDEGRVNMGGRPSYSKVIRGVETLRDFGIFPSVICVVTKRNVHRGAEMLRGLVEAGFTNIAFNAFYNVASDLQQDPFAVSDSSWTSFLIEVFEEWLSINRADVKVRELDGIIAWTRGRSARSCVFRGTCSSWMLVDYDGRVYPCERLGRSRCFGDVNEASSFGDILNSPKYTDFTQETHRVPNKCRDCSMKDFCHNGCVAHRIDDGDTSPHYAYCGSRLAFHRYLIERIGNKRSLPVLN